VPVFAVEIVKRNHPERDWVTKGVDTVCDAE
jgi:hypothetical protein